MKPLLNYCWEQCESNWLCKHSDLLWSTQCSEKDDKSHFLVATHFSNSHLLIAGVQLWKLEERPNVGSMLLRLNFSTDVAPRLLFLKDIGVEDSRFGYIISHNPFILTESLENLHARWDEGMETIDAFFIFAKIINTQSAEISHSSRCNHVLYTSIVTGQVIFLLCSLNNVPIFPLFAKGELSQVKEVQCWDCCVHGVQSSVSAQLQCEEAGQQTGVLSAATEPQCF